MQRFERAGVKLAYSTLTDWVSGTCTLITPLFEALKAEVLQSNYLHADETPIKMMDNDKKGQTHRATIGYIRTASIKSFYSITGKEEAGKDRWKSLKILKAICRPMGMWLMIFFLKEKMVV